MPSIKEKIALMIRLANGELVRHTHAKAAGIFVGDTKPSPAFKTRKRRSFSK